MPRDECVPAAQKHCSVIVMLRADPQHSCRRQLLKKNATFDLRLHDIVVYAIAEVRMRREGQVPLGHDSRVAGLHNSLITLRLVSRLWGYPLRQLGNLAGTF